MLQHIKKECTFAISKPKEFVTGTIDISPREDEDLESSISITTILT